MHRVLYGLAFASLASCVEVGRASDSDSSAPNAAAESADHGAASTATGTDCGVDPNTGISLCLRSSSCPGVRVDPDQFPDCGYRISGARIDLECLCGDSLCPMGSAASCLDVKALLAEQSALGVCAAVAEGRCETLETHAASHSSKCDQDCRSRCSGAPSCYTLCGC